MFTTDSRHHSATFESCKQVAQDAFEVTLKLHEPLSYQTGQYVWIDLLKLKKPDPKGSRRAFSIINPPQMGQKIIQILFRKSESGYKQTLISLKRGKSVTVIGSFGSSFNIQKELQYPLVLISGGVGVAPFLCILRSSSQQTHPEPIHLFHYENSNDRTSYKEELEGYNQGKNTVRLSTAKFEISDLQSANHLEHSLFFVAGPQLFVERVYQRLTKHGVRPSQFSFEEHYPLASHKSFFQILQASNVPTMDKDHFVTENDVFRKALDSAGSQIVITDERGTIYYANKAAEKTTGFTQQEMIGNTPRLWGGLMSQEFYENLWRMKLNGIPNTGEFTNRTKSGETYYAIVHINPILDQKQDVIGFIASEENITQIKRQEEQYNELLEHFQLAITSVNIATWEWNVNTDTLSRENHLEEILGVDLVKTKGGALRTLTSLIVESMRDEFEQELKKAIELPQTKLDTIFDIQQPHGRKVTVRAIANIARNKQGRATRMVGVFLDITKEKEIDRAKSEFVSLASHQLRTPLTSIIWGAEHLSENNSNLSKAQQATIATIQASSKRMSALVNTLLDVSRIEMGTLEAEPQPIDVTILAKEVIKDLESIIEEKQLKFKMLFHKRLNKISADPKLISIIFQNLISNAVQYTPAKGSIECEMKQEADTMTFRVTDTGIGIPKNQQSHLFQKLFRAENAKKMVTDGTGLGLYIVKSLLDRFGGTITFTSQLGKGSTFIAKIPTSKFGAISKDGVS